MLSDSGEVCRRVMRMPVKADLHAILVKEPQGVIALSGVDNRLMLLGYDRTII